MINLLRHIILGISVLLFSLTALGQENSREQLKGLDEQVQEIKTDVLAIAAELNQLEEKLISFAEKNKMKVQELDLLLWAKETGFVFK